MTTAPIESLPADDIGDVEQPSARRLLLFKAMQACIESEYVPTGMRGGLFGPEAVIRERVGLDEVCMVILDALIPVDVTGEL